MIRLAVAVVASLLSRAAMAMPPADMSGAEALRRGAAAVRHRDATGAATALSEALARARVAGDAGVEGEALMNLGLLHWYENRAPEARRAYTAALPLLRQAGRTESAFTTQLGLGLVALREQQFAEALGHFGRGRRTATQLRRPDLEARALRHLARTFTARGDLAGAESCWRRRLAMVIALGDCLAVAHTRHSLGLVYLRRGKHEAALEAFDLALHGAQANGDRALEVDALRSTASALDATGERRAARRHLVAARRLAAEAQTPLGMVRTLESLAQLALADGRTAKAARTAAHARRIAREQGVRSEVEDG